MRYYSLLAKLNRNEERLQRKTDTIKEMKTDLETMFQVAQERPSAAACNIYFAQVHRIERVEREIRRIEEEIDYLEALVLGVRP